MTSESALKACPFCGNEKPSLTRRRPEDPLSVVCVPCGTEALLEVWQARVLPVHVRRLVIAARRAVEAGDWASGDRRSRIDALDRSAEAFAAQVPWEDEPDAEADIGNTRASGWEPIATAPKDGTWIVVIGHLLLGTPDTVQWKHNGWWDGSSGFTKRKPTHWMPLPSPPENSND